MSGLLAGLFADDFYDIETINEIRLYFTQSNWDALLDQLYAVGEDRLLGTAVINGVTYDSIGVRYKGNSSYSANRTKNPFNIKLDHIRKEQTIGPYGTIKLANGFSDPSFIRETLAYEIARKYMPASKANYAKVYVNDVLIGAYTSVQDVDSHFMDTFFHCSDKPRFKSDTNTMTPTTVWGYLGADSLAYQNLYAIESKYGWGDLINFTNTLNNNPNNLSNVMNVDQNLWMCAFDNLLINLDSPINIFHNFYLFGDADNRINPILWDLNMSFGGFGNGTSSYNPLQNSTSTTFPLLSKVLSDARYKKMYIAHMRTMITENFSNGWYATRAAQLQAICGPLVQSDPNFFYTYANFQANLNSSVGGGSGGPGGGQTVPGITALMNARSTYLLSHSAFSGTVPEFTAQSHSPQPVEPGTQVTFTATASNATYMRVGIRQSHPRKFNYYQMYDDGVHGDGAAGDGTFGVSVLVSTGDIEYYFWAENASQGMFYPPRAEFEFFSIPVANTTGEIVINEVMAKNTSFPDPFGEMDDWVELYNPNNYPVDIGGMYMTDSHYSNGIGAWTQIPNNSPEITTIPANGYLIVWFDENLDQGALHINDKLGGGADGVYLISSDGQTLVDSYVWTEATDLNVDNRSIGRSPNGGQTWMLFGAGQLYPSSPGAANLGSVNSLPEISSIAYSPVETNADTPVTVGAVVIDTDGSIASVQLLYGVDDWTLNIESMTQNAGVYSLTLGGFPLNSVVKYRIKAIDNSNGESLSPVYSILIGYRAPILYINELMPTNTSILMDENGEYDDWVEIYNASTEAVDLAGYYLTDNHYPEVGLSLTQIASGNPETIIPAGAYKVIWFDEQPDQGALHVNTKLGTSADAVYLIAPDMLGVIDHVVWSAETALAENLSYGRYPDGSGTWAVFGINTTMPSPGAANEGVGIYDELSPSLVPSMAVYPNPARGYVNIELKNCKSVQRVWIYNLKGQLVNELSIEGSAKAGWNGRDKAGMKASSGIYFIVSEQGGTKLSRKICLVQ
jgi:hypothetical protein